MPSRRVQQQYAPATKSHTSCDIQPTNNLLNNSASHYHPFANRRKMYINIFIYFLTFSHIFHLLSALYVFVTATGIPSAIRQKWWKILWIQCGRPLKFRSGLCAMETMTGRGHTGTSHRDIISSYISVIEFNRISFSSCMLVMSFSKPWQSDNRYYHNNNNDIAEQCCFNIIAVHNSISVKNATVANHDIGHDIWQTQIGFTDTLQITRHPHEWNPNHFWTNLCSPESCKYSWTQRPTWNFFPPALNRSIIILAETKVVV